MRTRKGKFEPVPDNLPGIWDQHDGSVVGKEQVTDRMRGSRGFPDESTKRQS